MFTKITLTNLQLEINAIIHIKNILRYHAYIKGGLTLDEIDKKMEKLKMYGQKPFSIALIHGGPGAPGGMKSLAEELSKKYNILEPYQSCNSIDGQVEELKEILMSHAALPAVLIGHSWGAWLSYLFASKYPQMVSKIILIGCGAFESKYLSKMNSTRSNAKMDKILILTLITLKPLTFFPSVLMHRNLF